jgi:GTP cyclohydrolase I
MADEPKKIDFERLRHAAEEILLAIGEDLDREGLRKTPERVARMYAELLGGTFEDPRIHLQSVFTEKYDEIVLLRDIPF